MVSKLAEAIAVMPLCDTHEHLHSEERYVDDGPDILQAIFDHYLLADLMVDGASPEAVRRLVDASDPDIRARFEGVRDAWEVCQHTGFGEAARLIARHVYQLEELSPAGIESAMVRHDALRQPGERMRLLREVANIDHVQIDYSDWACQPDPSGPEFFLYDLSWANYCDGRLELPQLQAETGIVVQSLDDLRQAFAALFARHGPLAIAVKSQHAYRRTLKWQERSDGEVAPVLAKVLAGHGLSEAERICLGDWCWARGIELSIEYNLPFKLHTGYYAGYGKMPIDRIRSGHLSELLTRYPDARFVLMHIAYPYNDELVAIAKHFPNVYVDLCWAWSIDPRTTCDFVRTMIHAVPVNKLFAFGGDTFWPAASVAYAVQARSWLTRALQAEVDDRLLTERQAIAIAERVMQRNQRDCFDLEGTRAAIRRSLAVGDASAGESDGGRSH